MKYLILCLALMSGCGEAPSYIAPEAEPYYQEFLLYSQAFGVDVSGRPISIELVESTPKIGPWEVKGFCQDAQVRLNKNYWQFMNDDQKRLLVYHELGHCLLGLDHNPNPKSIMANSTDIALPYFLDDKDGLITQLFDAL